MLPLCLELALNQGCRFMGRNLLRQRFGAPTPPVEQMKTFDDVVAAFRRQVEDAVAEMVRVISWLEHTYRTVRPTAINSIMTDGCLDKGKDVTWGGGMYDLTSIQTAGLADAGDSLYAIKRLVFEEKRMSLSQLRDILIADYDGHEPLRRELVNKFPHYGNGNADVDAMTQLAADIYSDAIRAHKNTRGGRYVPGIYSMTCHIGFGRNTGALPSGRHAGARLSNGLSPIDGLDRSGPTGVLRSAASLDSHKWANCCALNMKFDKKIISGPAGKKSLSGIFRTFFDQGGMQVQANVLDADMMREARKDPTAHPGLVVRVAGYCAYFNDLQPMCRMKSSSGPPMEQGSLKKHRRLNQNHPAIFAVQHFCVHDGPGVRSIVFFKGCPLRCAWCQNPESWKTSPEVSFKAHLCIACKHLREGLPPAGHIRTRHPGYLSM